MVSNPADKPNAGAPWRTRASSVLTALSHGSAPFITTFLLIHLTAPAVANIGGSALSSQTMLLGREYYQTMFGERYLLFGPLFIHSSSAIIKRLFSPHVSRPLTSALSVTGYVTAFCFLPVHLITHRLAPADPAPPISSLSPSELDYEFVKAALSGWPRRSTVLYSVLVLGVALHAADGIGIIWSTWSPGLKLPGRKARRALTGAAIVPVLTGLAVIAREPLYAFASMAARYQAALTQSIVYRL
ncbi:hypothetical protein EDB92DRAFT_1798155 [Lactarius akahatsu]|uniref:Mitochondrial adapter protein MCP1 transmembrane domain-containing protein n=1 Tax=Lactarius akahatsu TaxID=416441 RepID=A0AAD4LLF1_9AGAM|nr:hypothetical protein EDB92DRAFT_1798155 [Lactarius akahatsu]